MNPKAKKFWNRVEWVLLHLTLVFSGMFLTLWILNYFNWQMEFLTSTVSNRLMLAYFSTALLSCGMYAVRRAKNGVSGKEPSAENFQSNPDDRKTASQPRPRPVRSVAQLQGDCGVDRKGEENR